MQILECQDFTDFYDDMNSYIVGGEEDLTKEDILKEIRRIFRVVMNEEMG